METVGSLKMGQPDDFSNFMSAVIDASAFKDHSGYISYAKAASDASIIAGGNVDNKVGNFVQPTVIQTTNPKFRTMQEVGVHILRHVVSFDTPVMCVYVDVRTCLGRCSLVLLIQEIFGPVLTVFVYDDSTGVCACLCEGRKGVWGRIARRVHRQY